MSEEILKAIIQLLAIVAKEDQVTLDEKASIKNFLLESLSKDDADRYFEFFESLIVDNQVDSDKDKEELDRVCNHINSGQTNQQKIVVILKLMELIAADGKITKRESELLYYISDQLKINRNLTDLVKAFVIFQERSKIVSSNILIADNGSNEIPEKCKHLKVNTLEGFIFILRVPDLEVYFAKYVGSEINTINHAPMRNNHVYVFPVGSVIKTDSAEPIFYSDVLSKFRQEETDSHLTFVAENLSFQFSNGNIGLRDINIQEDGGRLIALMGGSGAGKSTLLNVLNGNETPSEGSVRINGMNIHTEKKKVEGVIGYIPQDDLLVEELTVYENLFFAGKLCFKEKSNQELKELCEKTLEDLGLFQARNLKVGSPLDKSISGGQRKRLNIGLELLREPGILFVDEPTSGLSSRDSENIMELLKDLSLKGKMIFVVIHQPSEDIFKMFDKLILLDVGGYQIYYGNPVEAISYFKEIVNLVDSKTSANPEQIFNIVESKVVNEYGEFTNNRKSTPQQWSEEFKKRIALPSIKEVNDVPEKSLSIPNKVKQLLIFTHRDFKAKLSNKQYLLVNFLEAPVLAIILAFIIRYLPEDGNEYIFSKNLNIPVFFFMSVIVSLFMGLTVSAEEIIRDRKILKREAFLNLSRLSYLGSKVFILFAISLIQTLTYVLIGNFILEIQGMTVASWMILFSVSCFANVLGLNVSSAFKSAVTVYVLIPLLIIPQLILSGVVVNFDKLNPAITTEDKVPMIGEIMASRWAYEAFAVAQFKENEYNAPLYPHDQIITQSEFKNVYLIPRLESELEFVRVNYEDAGKSSEVSYKLETVRNEINKELTKIGKDKFQQVSDLTIDGFNNTLYDQTREFLDKLKSYYNLRAKRANQAKSEYMATLTDKIGRDQVLQLKQDNENEAVSTLVRNTTTEHRILEHRKEFVQKIYPIYLQPEFPDHALDFRGQFYTPSKHFLGMLVDTKRFNIWVIWSMTIALAIILYFDVLKKIISGFSR